MQDSNSEEDKPKNKYKKPRVKLKLHQVYFEEDSIGESNIRPDVSSLKGVPKNRLASKDQKKIPTVNGYLVESGRCVHVILKWHPDLQLYEFIHVTTSKKRAWQYLHDTFGKLIATIGRTEFEKIYKVSRVVAW